MFTVFSATHKIITVRWVTKYILVNPIPIARLSIAPC